MTRFLPDWIWATRWPAVSCCRCAVNGQQGIPGREFYLSSISIQQKPFGFSLLAEILKSHFYTVLLCSANCWSFSSRWPYKSFWITWWKYIERKDEGRYILCVVFYGTGTAFDGDGWRCPAVWPSPDLSCWLPLFCSASPSSRIPSATKADCSTCRL